MQALCLGTKASFSYEPTVDEMRKHLALKDGHKANHYKDKHLTQEEKEEAYKALVLAEESESISNRKTAGDASESGLVKFYENIFSDIPGRAESVTKLDSYRKKYPTFSYSSPDGKPVECLIPFSSEIKFNMFIRDLNHENENPSSSEDNLMVVMKGAPERILSRCSKILINGEEKDFD